MVNILQASCSPLAASVPHRLRTETIVGIGVAQQWSQEHRSETSREQALETTGVASPRDVGVALDGAASYVRRMLLVSSVRR
jgi:hypothetical protein